MNKTMNNDFSPVCLTIAGSDSGGNAGVQADLRAFHAYGVHGCTVFAALTAQNPFEVSAIHAVPADFVRAQLKVVLDVYAIRTLKTGMLAEASVITAVAEELAAHPEIKKVIDPVMIATSGAKLISDDAIVTLKTKLLPLADLITPNLPEAKALAGIDAEPKELAELLSRQFGSAVLVKGGHAVNTDAVDVLCVPRPEGGFKFEEFSAPWIAHPVSTHGTGCTLAAALAAELALGRDLSTAVAGAKQHVYRAIVNSHLVGRNCGVLGFDSAHEF